MRANSSTPSLVVVVLILVCGCTPAGDPEVVLAPPEAGEPPPAREAGESAPEPAGSTLGELLDRVQNAQSGPAQAEINEIRKGAVVDSEAPAHVPDQPIAARIVDRLIYQCTDDITFAVRVMGDRLQAFPPGYSNGFIVLERAAAEDGVRYVGYDADFRAKGDLATLRVGRARYVDCVSNPAAAVWQEPTRTR